ncbi:MAG: hypothetical protein GY862_21755, partial [Gammaproteobacteria bacterium]|nr:hypothetical protein [Gammaproteobacteria bacterium]
MTRLLGKLFDIKSAEWEAVGYFFLIIMVFSFGASIARSIGMTLLVQHLGGGVLPTIFILIDAAAMFGFLAYGHYTKKYSELTILAFFLIATAVFSVLVQLLFFFPFKWVYGFFLVGFFFFYILLSIHFGSVIAAYFTSVQSKRLTGFINAGFPIGGMAGGLVLITLLNFIPPQWLVLMLGFACMLALALLRQVHAKLSPVRTACAVSKRKKKPLDELNAALYYIVHSKLMIYMTIGLMLFVVASKMLEYQYQAIMYPEAFPDPTQRAKFFATYDIFANLAWLIIQIFVTSRIIVKLGIGASILLHPVLT